MHLEPFPLLCHPPLQLQVTHTELLASLCFKLKVVLLLPVDVTPRKKARFNYACTASSCQRSRHAQRADIDIGDVYADDKGGIWSGVNEEFVYHPLDKENESIIAGLTGVDEQCGSTISSQDLDLDPKQVTSWRNNSSTTRFWRGRFLSPPHRPQRVAKFRYWLGDRC
ncbi:hypothetical protein BDQ17DRAFT_1427346 [Cyathus striatus]|nr:hypothetical protein BDQ17DRAFT_1427346 [Cyathus striatus]